MEIQFNPETFIGKVMYIALLIVLPLLALTACGPTEANQSGPMTIEHPKACIALDTLANGTEFTKVKYLEAYPLVIGSGTRNRCSYSEETESVTCKAKSPDTLYTVSETCEPQPPKVN